MFLPVCPRARQTLDDRKSSYGVPGLSCETRALIIGFYNRVVDCERMIEKIRLDSRNSGVNSLRDVFDEFDWMGRGFLTQTEVRRHFDLYPDETQCYKMGTNVDANLEIELFLRRLNKDKLNGRVSLTDWLDELTPNLS